MSQYVGDITFYDLCRICGARVTSATRLVLNLKLDEHEAACAVETKKKLDARLAELRQLDLFGGQR